MIWPRCGLDEVIETMLPRGFSNMKLVVFYNHWHNGDLFISAKYVLKLAKLLNLPAVYAHKNDESVTRLFGLKKVELTAVPPSLKMQRFGYAQTEGILFVNTWVGAWKDLFPVGQEHANFETLHLIWKSIFESLSLELRDDFKCYLPDPKFFLIDKSKIDLLLRESCDKKRVLICNSPVASKQSVIGDMRTSVEALALEYRDIIFFLTHPIGINFPNVITLDYALGRSTGCLPEIAYLSTYCDLIVGKNSGPFTFAQHHANLFDATKTFLCFSKYKADVPMAVPGLNATFVHIEEHNESLVYTNVCALLGHNEKEKRVNPVGIKKRARVLVLTGSVESCGIYQYALSLYLILRKSKLVDFYFCPVSSNEDIDRHLQAHTPSVIIVNHHPATLSWLDSNFLESRVRSFGFRLLVITGHEHITKFDFADHHLSSDPLVSSDSGLLIPPPPVNDFGYKRRPRKKIQIIGTSGFGNVTKDFLSLAQKIRQEATGSIEFRIHVSQGHFIPSIKELDADVAAKLSQLLSNDVELKFERRFLPLAGLVGWLSQNDINLFNYNSQVQIGKSASVYRAMSSATALGVNHCPLLRHVLTAGNSVVEHNIQSIYEFFHDGGMDALYDAWHETKTIKYYEELCG
jgi:hypothetical protein